MKCQSPRLMARLFGEVDGRPITEEERQLLAGVEQHKRSQERKWWSAGSVRWRYSAAGRAYVRVRRERLRAISVKVREERLRTQWRNRKYRDDAMRTAKEIACDELLELIEEQEQEIKRGERQRRGAGEWTALSLDTPIHAGSPFTLADALPRSSDYWSDPTADTAIALVEWEQRRPSPPRKHRVTLDPAILAEAEAVWDAEDRGETYGNPRPVDEVVAEARALFDSSAPFSEYVRFGPIVITPERADALAALWDDDNPSGKPEQVQR